MGLQPKECPFGFAIGQTFHLEEASTETEAPRISGGIRCGANEGEDELLARTIGMAIPAIEIAQDAEGGGLFARCDTLIKENAKERKTLHRAISFAFAKIGNAE